MSSNPLHQSIKEQLIFTIDRYIRRLCEALDLKHIKPSGYKTRLAFHESLVKGFMEPKIYHDHLKGKFKEMPATPELFLPELSAYFWKNLLNANFDLIFAEDKSFNKILFDHFRKVYTAFGFTDLEQITNKLKAVLNLKKILLTSQNFDDVNTKSAEITSKQDSPRTTLAKLSAQLESDNNTLKLHRNKDWDDFYNTMSFILFPLALGRSLYSRITRGSWNFTSSEGEVFAEQAKSLLNKVT